jgi:Cytochrome P460
MISMRTNWYFGVVFVFASSISLAVSDSSVPYPDGFRTWRHVKSAIIGPGPGFARFGGLHHIYANEKAVEGYRAGNFQDGSVIVFDLMDTKNEGNTIGEGARKAINVMVKDSKRFADTGGWGYEEFSGDSKTVRTLTPATVMKECHECHMRQKDKDYVFSALRQ